MRLLLSILLISARVFPTNTLPFFSSSSYPDVIQRDASPQPESSLLIHPRQDANDTSLTPADPSNPSNPPVGSGHGGHGGGSPFLNAKRTNSADTLPDEPAATTPTDDSTGSGVTWTGPRPPGCTPEVSLKNCQGPKIWVWARDAEDEVTPTATTTATNTATSTDDGKADGDGGGKVQWTGPRPPGCTPEVSLENCQGPGIWVWARSAAVTAESETKSEPAYGWEGYADRRRAEDNVGERQRERKDDQDEDGEGDGGDDCAPAKGEFDGCPGGGVFLWANK